MINRIPVPEQHPRWIDNKRCDYFYERSEKILIAAYPELKKHFEEGFHYIGNVSISPTNGTDQPLKSLCLSTKIPQVGYGWYSKSFRIRGKSINLNLLRKAIDRLQIYHDDQVASWEKDESTTLEYKMMLTPAEVNYCKDISRCKKCKHLNILHVDFCLIPGCDC